MNKTITKRLVGTVLAAVLILPVACVQSTPEQSDTISPSPSSAATPPTTEQRIWNLKTIAEAEQVTGFKIYTPAYIPQDFALASSVMVSRLGFGENSYKNVIRLWLWKGDRDMSFQLMESEKYFEIGGGEPAEVNGKQGQRAFHQGTGDEPSSLSLGWEQDGLFFSLGGILKDPLTEQELLKIAASLEHLP